MKNMNMKKMKKLEIKIRKLDRLDTTMVLD
jgi:hypothetical protein